MLLRTAVNSPGYIVERKQDTINCCRHKLTSLIPNLGMVLSVSDTTSKIYPSVVSVLDAKTNPMGCNISTR